VAFLKTKTKGGQRNKKSGSFVGLHHGGEAKSFLGRDSGGGHWPKQKQKEECLGPEAAKDAIETGRGCFPTQDSNHAGTALLRHMRKPEGESASIWLQARTGQKTSGVTYRQGPQLAYGSSHARKNKGKFKPGATGPFLHQATAMCWSVIKNLGHEKSGLIPISGGLKKWEARAI